MVGHCTELGSHVIVLAVQTRLYSTMRYDTTGRVCFVLFCFAFSVWFVGESIFDVDL